MSVVTTLNRLAIDRCMVWISTDGLTSFQCIPSWRWTHSAADTPSHSAVDPDHLQP